MMRLHLILLLALLFIIKFDQTLSESPPSIEECKRRGEVYRIGQICESIPSCQYPNGPENICMAIGPKARCYCRSGYLRNQSGICVPENKC